MGNLTFRKRRNIIRMDIVKEIFFWVIEAFAVCMLSYMLVAYLGKEIPVIGNSMEKELKEGENVLTNRIAYLFGNPKRGDVIVFKPNGNENSHYYIKRVVALPGETVQITNGELVVLDEKGQPVKLDKQDYKEIEYAGSAEEPLKINDGEFFVIGDNFNYSEDSRYADIGNVKKTDIEGKAWCKRTSFFEFKKVQ